MAQTSQNPPSRLSYTVWGMLLAVALVGAGLGIGSLIPLPGKDTTAAKPLLCPERAPCPVCDRLNMRLNDGREVINGNLVEYPKDVTDTTAADAPHLPRPGETWVTPRPTDDPFAPEPGDEPFRVKVLEVRQGWIRYDYGGRYPRHRPLTQFRQMFQPEHP